MAESSFTISPQQLLEDVSVETSSNKKTSGLFRWNRLCPKCKQGMLELTSTLELKCKNCGFSDLGGCT